MGEIETGIPIPDKPGRPMSAMGKKVREMKVGDSRTCTEGEAMNACNIARQIGMKFTRAREGDHFRIWRVE